MITALSLNLPCSKGVRPHLFIFIFPAVEEYSHVSSDHLSSYESDYDAFLQASQSPLTDTSSNYPSSFLTEPSSELPESVLDFEIFNDLCDIDEFDISDFLLSSTLFDTA